MQQHPNAAVPCPHRPQRLQLQMTHAHAPLRHRNRRVPVARLKPLDEPHQGTCSITLKDMRELDAQQIFTTCDGKNYERRALKQWLSISSIMPHSNIPSPQDLVALKRDTHERRAKALALAEVLALLLVGASLVCCGAVAKLGAVALAEHANLPPPPGGNGIMLRGRASPHGQDGGTSVPELLPGSIVLCCLASAYSGVASAIIARHM